MSNPKTNWIVDGAVWRDVDWDVYLAVDRAVYVAVRGAVSWGVYWTVGDAVSGAAVKDSAHPGLQDFLLVVRES